MQYFKFAKEILGLLLIAYVLFLILWPEEQTREGVVRTLVDCQLPAEILGDDPELLYERSIATAGVWMPPVEGCTKFATVQGSKGTVKLYQSGSKDGPCFHVRHHTGKMKKQGNASTAIYKLMDVRSCKLVNQ